VIKYIQWVSAILLAASVTAHAQAPKKRPAKKLTLEQRFPGELKHTPDSEARLDQWFRDAKFGVFIHFGIYSPLAGEYKGRIPERPYSEWIQNTALIPAQEYHQVAARFDPSDFDAEEWVRIFKQAGARYVVITAKHHDGFALFKSNVSPYNIVDATPFTRDIIQELGEACHRNGLKFGVYYSQAQDWNEPDAPVNPQKRTILHPDLPVGFKPDMDRYIGSKALPQVEELVKNHELDLIWFDTPKDMTLERAKLFSETVRRHRPDCLINSRIYHGGPDRIEKESLPLFDYASVRDKEVPDGPLPLYFECPDSVSSSYGYKEHGEVRYHTEKELLERFVHTVCAGGNYLLNNGPMGNGKLDPEAVRLYGVIGEWMKDNSESLIGTRPNPLPGRPEWGDVSISKDGSTLYLHILDWPEAGTITVNELPAAAIRASYLANGNDADFKQDGSVLHITLPPEPVNAYDTVIRLVLDKGLFQSESGTFARDVAFLGKHTDVVVLENGRQRVAVVPQYQGRVMTSSTGDGSSFGWLNYKVIERGIRPLTETKGSLEEHIHVFGGEERFWLGPEGGQFGIFFQPGDPFEFAAWKTPPSLDTLPYRVVSQTRDAIAFAHDCKLLNHSGTEFSVGIERTIRLLGDDDVGDIFGKSVPNEVQYVAYESDNVLKNTGDQPWTEKGGMLSIWLLGMYKPSPGTTVVIPFKEGPEATLGPAVNDTYFGKVPPEYMALSGSTVFFKGDGTRRGKIGISPARSKGIAGSYNADDRVLTLVTYNVPENPGGYVNSMWEIQEKPFGGDVINSYNDGSPGPGLDPLGPFYELETSSPAAALKPGESRHYQNDEDETHADAPVSAGMHGCRNTGANPHRITGGGAGDRGSRHAPRSK
jgi:alpha-L-fucosidase